MKSAERGNCKPLNNRRPHVAVMILNFNGLPWLRICLPSVLKSKYENIEFVVIDNGSVDGSTEFVESEFRTVRVIRFNENLGFAEAYNKAIQKVECDYAVLLNNDTQVLEPNWIEHLIREPEKDDSIAVVGCKIVTMKNHHILDSVGVMGIRYWRGFVDIGKYEDDNDQYDNPPITPFSACGAAMLIRRTDFLQVRGFDSKFFAYVEDVDLCWRMRLRGYKVIYQPAAVVAHYFAGTSGAKQVDTVKLYLSHRNVLRSVLKNCGSSLGWALRTFLLFSSILIVGFSFQQPGMALSIVKALVWNVRNLNCTLTERHEVRRRAISDEEAILSAMYPRYPRYEPADHTSFRKRLDMLFDRNLFCRPSTTAL